MVRVLVCPPLLNFCVSVLNEEPSTKFGPVYVNDFGVVGEGEMTEREQRSVSIAHTVRPATDGRWFLSSPSIRECVLIQNTPSPLPGVHVLVQRKSFQLLTGEGRVLEMVCSSRSMNLRSLIM